ncbi:MAG: septum formation protein Maf [Flavobacteriales bacterium]|jgi:septum formation protein|nr:MAG: septum formation protein Maf [Flavobacteriales bacterium]|tara:strand:- start:3198 stop:3776 length:579 start_codon:yes stop_codon:yes gene_type:complete
MTNKLYLGSGSPRRVELLTQMNIPFEQRVIDVEEVYPNGLKGAAITDFLAKLKGNAHQKILLPDELVLTADTIVWHEDAALGKPKNEFDAIKMLTSLSGKTHDVISSVCLSSVEEQNCIKEITKVTLRELTKEEIAYYVQTYKPLDKAGAYGIQEWIGLVGVKRIKGSYTNVVGLPSAKTHQLLQPYLMHFK